MKKIVGIFAAAAVLATSVFAADISAKVQLEGNLFKFGTDKSISMFDIDKPSDQHWNPVFNITTSTDNAGAEFVVYTGTLGSNGSWNKAFENGSNRFKIWMSPADGFKLIFGLNGFNLNQEHINWSKSDSGVEDYGYSLNYSANGLSIDFGVLPGWQTAWMSKADGGDVAIGKTGFKFQYGADFGTVNAILVAENTFKTLKFGAGYANNFSGINIFANVLGYMADSNFNKLRAEIYAEGNADALAWKVFPVIEFSPNADDKVEALLYARIDYNFGAANFYLYIEDEGLTKIMKGKPLVVKPGLSGNIGGAGWDVALKFDIDEKVGVSVPVVFNMAW